MRLTRALAPFRKDKGAGPVEIGGMRVSGLRAVKPPQGGNALNKANRLVLAGSADCGSVKIYEAASAAHARFIAHVSGIGGRAPRLPEVLATSGAFVVSRWIEGTPLAKRRLDGDALRALAGYQAALHAIPAADLPAPAFDYWEEIIVPRFLRAGDLLGHSRIAGSAVDTVRAWRAAASPTVNHPDISLDNIVETADGEQVAIDNELLYVGAGAFMDAMNTLRGLTAEHRPAYLEAFLNASGPQRPFPEPDVIRAFWLARQAGARFVAGAVEPLRLLFEAAEAGQVDLDGVLPDIGAVTAIGG
ncbi:MAG TPA: phosphotransferase [Allosphingosinicella sp.]